MIRRFKKALFYLLLLLSLAGPGIAVQAQEKGDNIGTALKEARDAGVSETTLNRLLALGYEKQVEPSAMGNLLAIVAQCQRENLPLQPFLSKIEEGMSKGVSAARIEQVLKNKLEDYRFTRSLIDQFMKRHGKVEPVSPEYHVRLTETLYCGVSRKDLDQLLDEFPHASLPLVTRGAEVLASLKQIQFDPKLSEQLVDTGVKQGFFTAEQKNFPRIIALAREKGVQDDQIAAIALKVIENRGSQSDFSSQLGISALELGRQGPQVGAGGRGFGEPENKDSVGATGRGLREGLGRGGEQAGPSGGGSGSGRAGEQAVPSGGGSGSGRTGEQAGSRGDSSGGGEERAAPDGGSGGGHGKSEAGPGGGGSGGPGKEQAASGGGAGHSHGRDEAGPGSGDSSSRGEGQRREDSKPFAESAQHPKNKSVTFTAAGKVTQIDYTDSSLTLAIEKANRVLTGCLGELTRFVISEKVKVKTEGSEPEVFDLGLDDIKAEGDYIRVFGKKLADGTLLITHIVVYLEEGDRQQEQRSVNFTAVGKVTQIDPTEMTLTLDVEKANRVLSGSIEESALFVISETVKVKTEGSEPGVFDLNLDDINAGVDYLSVLGRKLANDTFQITHIVVHPEKGEQHQNNRSLTFSAAGAVTQIDPTEMTLTLAIEQANRVLGGRIGEEAPFVISKNVKVKTEGSEPGVSALDLNDIKPGVDYLRVLGKSLASGALLVTQIVVYGDE